MSIHYRWSRVVRYAGCWLLAVGCVCGVGCIRRTLTIRSEPPGATLLVNDKDLGTTPYTDAFEWYGWYRITLTKEGYERLDDRVLLRAPFHFWIPLDLVMELLPFEVRDTKTLSYALREKQPLPMPVPPRVAPRSQGKTTESGGTER